MTYREAYARMLEQQTEEWDIPPEEIHDFACPDHVFSLRGEPRCSEHCAECWDREAPAEPAEPASWVRR